MRLMLGWLNDALQCQQPEATNTPVYTTIPLRTPIFHDLQVSKCTLNSCLTPVYTLPLWMTLLLFPSLRVVATSMEFFRPCHLLFLPVPRPCYCCCCLLKDYHEVVSANIHKLSVNPSALETCAPNTNQLHDFKFLVCTYHVYDSILQCVKKFFEASPL